MNHYYVTFTGSDKRADALDPGFAADPAAYCKPHLEQAARLSLFPIFMLPAGYKMELGRLMNSNLAPAIAEPVWSMLAGMTRSFGVYGAWHPAAAWRSEPHRTDTTPMESAARAQPKMAAGARRAWTGIHLRPLQALTRCTTFIMDWSGDDGAGLTVCENELAVHGTAHLLGELPPNLPHPNGTNDRVLDVGEILRWPKLGWVGRFSKLDKLKLIDCPAPIFPNGKLAELRAVVFPEYAVVDGRLVRGSPPDPARLATAKRMGWHIDIANGWSDDEAKAIMNPDTD